MSRIRLTETQMGACRVCRSASFRSELTFDLSHRQTLAKGGVTYRDEPWHKECFVCASCKTQLAGQHFTSRDESPYCLKCFGNLYAKKCEACSKPITGKMRSIHWCMSPPPPQVEANRLDGWSDACALLLPGFGGGKYVSFEERQWHQPCFTCSQCSASLVGAGFFPDGERILCRDCNSGV